MFSMNRRLQKPIGLVFSGLFAFLSLSACAASRPPIPPGQVPSPKPVSLTDEQYGHQVFQQLSDRYELDYNHPRTMEVQQIVERLTTAIGAAKDPWHVYVFKDKNFKNAAATRGNHVFVWTGMLDSTKNEAELATIIAHEISHLLAGHTEPDPNEEVKKMLIGIGSIAAGIAIGAVTRNPYANVGDIVSGLTNEVGQGLFVYPYSRDNEFEADQVGLFLMARAKYDPRAAVEFWTRAAQDPSFSASVGFLSTHPPAGDRLVRLQELLPQAIATYEGREPPRQLTRKDLPAQTTSASGEDSFAMDGKTGHPVPPSQQPGLEPAPPKTSAWSYVVSAERALLYPDASRRKQAIGEFRRGAQINVVEKRGEWVRIEDPDPGFLSARDVREK